MNIFGHLSFRKKRPQPAQRLLDPSSPQLSKRHWAVKAFKGAVRQIAVSQTGFFFLFFREFETAEQLEEKTDRLSAVFFFLPSPPQLRGGT